MANDNKIISDLKQKERELIEGYEEPVFEEQDQVIQIPAIPMDPPEDEDDKVQKLVDVREKARAILEKIAGLKSQLDGRCAHLEVPFQRSNKTLRQAMYRVFGEYTTAVKYEHYKKAVEMRAQLSQETVERNKLK